MVGPVSAPARTALEGLTIREQMRRNTRREVDYLEGFDDVRISEVRPVLGRDYENQQRELDEVERQIRRERELLIRRPVERIRDTERSIINNGR